jgi:hypothetical protein
VQLTQSGLTYIISCLEMHIVITLNEHHIKIENVIQYPHIVSMYMHHRFNIFHEEVIQKYLGAKDFWYMFMFIFLLYAFYFWHIFVFYVFIYIYYILFFLGMSGNIEVQPTSMVSYGWKVLLTWKH